ncbi:hypothetical protein VNO80_09613 [Phaseolus coccineus]|uniref:Uncharacterized protein n=1 Tax=Phaseolus coccineus TaxID=3886 RepID=A0AAN9NCW5_PHACN
MDLASILELSRFRSELASSSRANSKINPIVFVQYLKQINVMDNHADTCTCMTQLCKESLLKHFPTTPRQRNQCRGEGFLAVGMPNEQ